MIFQQTIFFIYLILPPLIFKTIMVGDSVDRMPNIIIILADDLGYGDLGGYYGGNTSTPNIDRLAREGMLFTDFHSNGTMCSPTRASLLTGRYPQRLGVETARKHVLDLPENQNEVTIADYLKKTGYKTGIFGKWHLGRPINGNPVHFGFDKFVGFHSGDLDYFSKRDRYNGELDWWHNEELLDQSGYITDLITKESKRFIEESKGSPFFLYVSHLAIHFPWQGPNDSSLWQRIEGVDYTSNLPGENSKLGPNSPAKIPNVLEIMIEELDESVGSIMQTLQDNDLKEKTLVFFLSDNGNYINYSGNTWPKVGSNGFLNGQKMSVFEGGHRVPAIAWWPGKIPPLSVTDETVMTMDLFPTIVDLIGKKTAKNIQLNAFDGISLVPLILKGKTIDNRTLFWRIGDQKAVRYRQWKLIKQNDSVRLYNLSSDIVEQKNIAHLHPDISEMLQNKLSEWEKDVEKN